MWKKWFLLLMIIFFCYVGNSFVDDGRSYCKDGTRTYSSGSGTCSWHKGQGVQPEKQIIFYIFSSLLLVWIVYYFVYPYVCDELLDREINKIINTSHHPCFDGYSEKTPKEVIIQLLMQADNPKNKDTINEVCKIFKMNSEEANKLADEAMQRNAMK